MQNLPSPERLRALIEYNAETGLLIWKERPDKRGGFNAKFAGRPALNHIGVYGYRSGGIERQMLRAHRVCWAIAHGEWPDRHIDHINGDRSDNRLNNLRLVSRTDNMRNMRRSTRNTSGTVGVYWERSRSKWLAMICVDRRLIKLGRFETKERAIAARKAGEAKYAFHENHGREAAPG